MVAAVLCALTGAGMAGASQGQSGNAAGAGDDAAPPRHVLPPLSDSLDVPIDGIEPEPATREQLLVRANVLNAARLAADYATLWEFRDLLTVAHVSREEFIEWSVENDPFVYDVAETQDVAVDGRWGWVRVRASIGMRRAPSIPPRTIERWERWIHVCGRWLPVSAKEQDNAPQAPAERDLALEPLLQARYDAWWKAVEARDWRTLYEMSDPLDREQVDFETFARARNQLTFFDHQVLWRNASSDSGIVRVRYLLRLNDPNMTKMHPVVSMVNERWVRRDGQWYHRLLGGAER